MHGHALAASDISDDAFAADGIAALGAIDHQIVHALDADDGVSIRTARHARGLGNGFRLRRGRFGHLHGFRQHLPGRQLLQHLAGGILAVAQGGMQILDFAVAVIASDALETAFGYFAQLHAQSPGFLLQILLADLDGLQPLAGVDDVLDLVAGLGGLDQRQPILAGQVAGLGHNLDDVAIAQRIAQRHDTAVDLGAHAGLADIGVNGVSEIDGGGVARQHDHFTARGESVDFLGVKVHLEGGHELAGVLHVALPLDQMAQPGDALVVGRGALLAFLVFPVRGYALFGDAVHFLGADLHFEVLAVRADDGRMQGLVEIGARDGDEVLDAAGNGAPLVVNHTQRGVAVFDRVGDDAQGHQIVNLLDGDFLALDLLINGIRPLEAPFYARGNAFAAQFVLHGGADLGEELFVGMALRFDGLGDFFEGFGVEMAERQVLQLAAHFAHAEAVRDGRVDLDGLSSHVRAALGAQIAERAHVVQAIGQLHDDDADIVHHGQQHFTEAFGLAFLGVEDIEFAELGDAIDAAGDFVAETLADFVGGHAGVFDKVVQQSGFDGDQIHAHAGQDMGDHEGMHHVGLAGLAQLAFVQLGGGTKSFFYGGEVVARAVLADLVFEFLEELLDAVGWRRDGWRVGGGGDFGGHYFDCSGGARVGGWYDGQRRGSGMPQLDIAALRQAVRDDRYLISRHAQIFRNPIRSFMPTSSMWWRPAMWWKSIRRTSPIRKSCSWRTFKANRCMSLRV